MMIKNILSEFLGTLLLVCIVVGSGIMGENLSSGNDAISLLANSLATFWGLYFLITIFSVNSSHFNPAVSLVMHIRGEIKFLTFLFFVFAQSLGAVLGAILANVMFGFEYIEFSEKPRTGLNIWLSEIVATAGLLIVILASPKDKVAIMVASFIGAAYWFTSSTSFANPAVTFGRIFSDSFAGISPYDFPMFVLMQFVGCLAGLGIYKIIFPQQD